MERIVNQLWCDECMYTCDTERYPCGCPFDYDQLHPDCPMYEEALWAVSNDPLMRIEWVDRALEAEREIEQIDAVLFRLSKDLDEPFYGDKRIDITQRLKRFAKDAVEVIKEAKACHQR